MLARTGHHHQRLAVPDPSVHHMDFHSCSPGIGVVGESASLGRWRHVAERGGGAEASALGVERMTTVALPLDLFIVEFLLSMNDIRASVQETVFF